MKIIKINREAVPKIGRIIAESDMYSQLVERCKLIKKREIQLYSGEFIRLPPSFYELDFTENEIDYVKNELSKPEYSTHNWAQLILIQI